MSDVVSFRCRLAFLLGAARGAMESAAQTGDDRARVLADEIDEVFPIMVAALDALEVAAVLAQHWVDQEGFNSSVIDALAWRVARFHQANRAPLTLGPYASRCTFCGTYGDESTQDPVSGDGQMCFACADKYQRGPA